MEVTWPNLHNFKAQNWYKLKICEAGKVLCLHLKFLDIEHPLTFEVRKLILRQIEAHGLIYLRTENFETLSYIMWHYHFESSYQAICLILSTYLILGMHIILPKVITFTFQWKNAALFCLVFSFCLRGYFPDPMLISDCLLVWRQGVEGNRNHTERKKKHQINKVKRVLYLLEFITQIPIQILYVHGHI